MTAFIIGLVIAFIFLRPSIKVERVVECDRHKWEYDIQGHLYCKDCKRRPG